MNIKEMIVLVGFALLTTWGIDYFIMSRFRDTEIDQARSGQTFNAPDKARVVKPLMREIDFVDTKRVAREVITEVETEWADLTFSSEGAALERLEFKRKQHGAADDIITIFPVIEREQKALLVALDEKTPYYFTLTDKQDGPEAVQLTYEGNFGDGILRKRFNILKHLHKIDVTIEIEPNNADRAINARIFYPSPVMPDVERDQIAAVVTNVKGSLDKIQYDKLNLKEGWWSPAIFGAENRYFVHALIEDDSNFVERAYFTTTPDKKIISILEGPEVTTKTGWTLSFYFGPKDTQAMGPVDERLEQTLDYSGLLAPLSKLLLKLLNMINEYVKNYGLAIIILTVLMRLFMLPFTLRGERNMRKSGDVQKKMQYLQQKYKNDPERLRIEQAELIKKYGMPQLTGCLPLLIQFPMFIALNRVLSNSIELYQAPFIGWITDLSVPDPYYILPALIGISMFVNALTMDPKQRSMMMVASLVIGVFSMNFASGLLIYISVSTLLGILQSSLQKKIKVA
jgi:YidC/Oxa1 family membrane protein insertase